MSRSTEVVLRLDRVSRRYGGVVALDDFSMEIERGERHTIIGPNGAGKTTLFKLISRLERLSTGRIELFGVDTRRMSPHGVARLGVGRTYQVTRTFPRLSVLENVVMAVQGARPGRFRMLRSALRHKDLVRKAHSTLERVGLADVSGAPASSLGYGEQRQVELALALAADPMLILLDEPAAGLSGAERGIIRELVSGFPRDITLLLIEHDMELALGLAERVTCLHNGSAVAQGTPTDVKDNERVQDIYLGRGA